MERSATQALPITNLDVMWLRQLLSTHGKHQLPLTRGDRHHR
jgi:hypothetical protein